MVRMTGFEVSGIFGYRRRFAVPDKIFGLSLFLDFIDRCTKLLILYLPLAGDKQFAQSKFLALLASCRWSILYL